MIDKQRRDLKVIEIELQTALKGETKGFIAIGDLLLEAKEQLDRGDDWLPWLKENFGKSQRTSYNYMNAARFASKFATVANLKLRPTALYYLGNNMESIPLDEIETIFEVAKTEWVDDDCVVAIIEAMHAERRGTFEERERAEYEEKERAEDERLARASDKRLQHLEEWETERSEAEALLDAPQPELPPAPPPAAVDFTVQSFDQAVDTLFRLHTKPLPSFVATKHTPKTIMDVITFLRSVFDDM